jgi:cytochrome bd ubiquinol oxidase subunit II
METLWFCLVAIMIAAYVVLDGFDLGAGILHFCVARNESERRVILRSIGPVWDGNEVWLLAGGGTLYFAFPPLYSASFSGFYLPLMMVLWLLILRGVSIELRNHIDSPTWKPIWDAGFMVSGALLAIFYGAALGNVIRGVPLNATGNFFLPLWTNFGIDGELGILDWYTVSVGVLAFVTLTMHGALWLGVKTEGDMQIRSSKVARVAWVLTFVMTALVTYFTFGVQPNVGASLAARPWGYVFPLLALGGLAAIAVASSRPKAAFLGSCAYIIGMLTSAVFGVYPMVLPARPVPANSLTIHNAAAGAHGLSVGLVWFIPAFLLALGYFTFLYRHFGGKVRLEGEGY